MFNVQNLISISDFRQNVADWLDKVSSSNPILIIQHSKPKAVLIDPEYLEYLEKYADGYYDSGDISEVQRAIAKGELKTRKIFNPSSY